MTLSFSYETLIRLEELAHIYSGFRGSLLFELPQTFAEHIEAFTAKRRLVSGWGDNNCEKYVLSKKVDYSLVNHAISRGYRARFNDEFFISKDGSFDFDVDSAVLRRETRVESKHMPSAVKHEIAIREPFEKNEACLKWRNYDIFLGWCSTDGLDREFRPWVLTLNCFLSSPAWAELWDDNHLDKKSRGGKNLKLDSLPPELRKGFILL